ncbi:MAG: hypothetical protein AAGJ40_02835 [Planctomycetota bacterium]
MATTLDEVYESLDANADFEEVGSVAKAKAFATAATKFLFLSPQSQADQGSSMTISVQQVENLLHRARAFVDGYGTDGAVSSRGGVRFLSASEGFRR